MATAKKTPEKAGTHISKGAHVPVFRASADRLAAGRLLRDRVPRSSHADWKSPANRRDPIDILDASNQGRLPELVPVRYGRMLRSPVTFLRGSSALMADYLATTPTTGIRVQACGDCHLLNFGCLPPPSAIWSSTLTTSTRPTRHPGTGPQAPGGQLCDRRTREPTIRCSRPSCGCGVYARLSRTSARVFRDEPAGRLVRAYGRGNHDGDSARCQSAKVSGTDRCKSPPACHRTSLSQDCQRGRRAISPGRSTAGALPCRGEGGGRGRADGRVEALAEE